MQNETFLNNESKSVIINTFTVDIISNLRNRQKLINQGENLCVSYSTTTVSLYCIMHVCVCFYNMHQPSVYIPLTLRHSILIHIRQPCCVCMIKKQVYITAWCAQGQWVNKGKVLLSIYRVLLERVCVCLSVRKSNSTDVNSKEIANKMFTRSPTLSEKRVL